MAQQRCLSASSVRAGQLQRFDFSVPSLVADRSALLVTLAGEPRAHLLRVCAVVAADKILAVWRRNDADNLALRARAPIHASPLISCFDTVFSLI